MLKQQNDGKGEGGRVGRGRRRNRRNDAFDGKLSLKSFSPLGNQKLQNWTDSKLKWDPQKYGNITDIRFSGSDAAPAKLWKPDILLFNR